VVVETIRGGPKRGAAAIVGAAIAFAALLILVALGLSFAQPASAVSRVLQLVGGLVLVVFGIDGFRSADVEIERDEPGSKVQSSRLPTWLRVGLASLLFPGTWIFLAAVATPLMTSTRSSGGVALALVLAMCLVLGASAGNTLILLLVGWGRRAAQPELLARLRRWLSVGLALIGVGLAIFAVLPQA
jgi:threonine/homoserine/homoserine lactone efflux protein